MPKLKCKAENCAYNYDWLCKKNYIDVDGLSSKKKEDTRCMSFCEKGCERDTEFATLDEMPSKQTEVYCDATNCVYEKDQKCKADKIEIACDEDCKSRATHCQTFEPCE